MKKETFKCEICNLYFTSPNGLGNHIKQLHKIETEKYYSEHLKKDDEGLCKECNKKTNFISLNKGFRTYCGRSCSKKYQPNSKGWAYVKKEGYFPWNKNKKMEEEHKKNWIKSLENSGHWKNPWNKNKKMTDDYKRKWRKSTESNVWKTPSEETKRKLRIKMIEKLKLINKNFHPPYNPKGCKYFNKIMDDNKCFIQHAENLGEYHIKELGYYLDGYDKENNIVYEWDEKNHYREGRLIDKDLKRQEEIIKFLNCKFIRFKSWELESF